MSQPAERFQSLDQEDTVGDSLVLLPGGEQPPTPSLELQSELSEPVNQQPANKVLEFLELQKQAKLSSEELEVAAMAASGFTKLEIAQWLKIREEEITTNLTNILRKTGVLSIREVPIGPEDKVMLVTSPSDLEFPYVVGRVANLLGTGTVSLKFEQIRGGEKQLEEFDISETPGFQRSPSPLPLDEIGSAKGPKSDEEKPQKEKRGAVVGRIIDIFENHVGQTLTYDELTGMTYPDIEYSQAIRNRVNMTLLQGRRKIDSELKLQGLQLTDTKVFKKNKDGSDSTREIRAFICEPIIISEDLPQVPIQEIDGQTINSDDESDTVGETVIEETEIVHQPEVQEQTIHNGNWQPIDALPTNQARSEYYPEGRKRISDRPWEDPFRDEIMNTLESLDRSGLIPSQNGSGPALIRFGNREALQVLFDKGLISLEQYGRQRLDLAAAVTALLSRHNSTKQIIFSKTSSEDALDIIKYETDRYLESLD